MSKIIHSLKKGETALLIIDMQNDFCKPNGFISKSGKNVKNVIEVISKIKHMLDFARSNGIFRIFIKTIHLPYTTSSVWASRFGGGEPKLCLPDTWGSEIVDELKPEAGEPIVVKHRYDAFINTDLDLILRSKRVKNLLITGTATNVCVYATATHAFMLDYLVVIIEDCIATHDEDLHEPFLRNLRNYFGGYVFTSDQVMKIIT